jgi:NAD(P)H dehydrogenase (quinone)
MDAEWADAIVFGTPTRFGSVSSELKAYIDSLGSLWVQGKLNGKAGAAFCSTSTLHGGNEFDLALDV